MVRDRKFRQLVEEMPQAFAYLEILLNEDGNGYDHRFLFGNLAFHQLFIASDANSSQSSVKDDPIASFLQCCDWVASYKQVTATNEPVHFEQYLEAARRWYTIKVFSEEPGYLAVLVSDITEHENQNASRLQLETEQRRLQYVLGATNTGFDIIDADLNMVYADPGLEKVYGKPKGQKCYEYFRGLSEPCAQCGVAEAMQNKKSVVREQFMPRNNRYVEIHTIPIQEPDGCWVVAEFRIDITEHKQLQDRLRESEAFTRQVMDNLPIGIAVHALEPTVEFTYMNDKFAQFYRVPKGILTEKDTFWHAVYPDPDVRLALQKRVIDDIVSGQPERMFWPDIPLVRKGEETTYVSAKATPLQNSDQVVSTVWDVTDRKKAEISLRLRLQQMEAMYSVLATVRLANSIQEALPRFLEKTLQAVGADAGVIGLFEPEKEQLRLTFTQGWFDEIQDATFAIGEGIVGAVLAAGCPLISEEFVRDKRLKLAGKTPPGWGGACLPLRAGHEIVGVLVVAVPSKRPLDEATVRLLNSLADMAGTAIQRIGLHQQAVGRMKQLEDARAIDLAISSSMDLDLVLRIAVDKLVADAAVDVAAVCLSSQPEWRLERVASKGFRTAADTVFQVILGEGDLGRATRGQRSFQFTDLTTAFSAEQAQTLQADGIVGGASYPLVIKGDVVGVLLVFCRSTPDFDSEVQRFMELMGGQVAIAVQLARTYEGMQQAHNELTLAYDATIAGLARSLELRDYETEGHCRSVADRALQLGRQMGLGEEQLVHLYRGALLHDIGKMGIPDGILLKPGPLTEEEWQIMRRHAQYGYDLLSPVEYLRPAVDVPYCHHEKWDGTGYPQGLKGQSIPVLARIFAVVDVYDALVSDRPYRDAWPRKKALQYVQEQRGSQFDPDVVDAFLQMMDKELEA